MDRLAYWVMLLPPLFWAGNFVLGRYLGELAFPITLSFLRWVLASLILLPFIIRPMWEQRAILRRHWRILVLLSFLGVSCFNTLGYYALTQTTATNATLLLSMTPVAILLLVTLFFRARLSASQIIGIVLSFLGVVGILSQLSPDRLIAFRFNAGDFWVLLACLAWALYGVLQKYYRPEGLSGLAFLGYTVIIGTIILLPLYLWNPLDEHLQIARAEVKLGLAYVAIFPSILAYLAWNYGVQQIGAAKAGQYIHLQPIITAILAVLFLGERIEVFHLVSAGFIATGLYLGLRSNEQE